MYHGTQQHTETHYTTKYYPGIGDLPAIKGLVQVTRHLYICDRCQRRYAFPEAADEPFYCDTIIGDKEHLVSIDRS